MQCSIEGCQGEYEVRKVAHTVRHQGEVVVIDPLQNGERPTGAAPLYEFA